MRTHPSRASREKTWLSLAVLALVGGAAACSGTSYSGLATEDAGNGDASQTESDGSGGNGGDDGDRDARPGSDGATSDGATGDATIKDGGAIDSSGDSSVDATVDAARDAGFDAADARPDTGGIDGVPVRVPCVNTFGQGLSQAHGRLDGYLVSVVQPGNTACNADADHVHLQVRMNGSVYDVAVTIRSNKPGDELFLAKDAPLSGAWTEGWHTAGAAFDYVSTLGLHSTDFASTAPDALVARLNTELATANHVAVFATGYGAAGAHLVHRNVTDEDGAIVINPLGPSPRYLLLHFVEQTF